MNSRETLNINDKGHLQIGGADTVDLAAKFGTPLYVFDEKYIRDMCKVYNDTLTENYGNGIVLYASKAFSCKAIYKIVNSENLGVDVVSEGELYTALNAGFPAEKIYMHGNNKLKSELEYAISNNIGTIVADAESEIDIIDELAAKKGIKQDILLRVNPGVEAHTHHYIQTAKIDSKFGFSISNGTAYSAVKHALSKMNVSLKGVHCHIGSQIFEKKPFALAVNILTDFMALVKNELSYEMTVLNMGGGYGIWYSEDDKKMQMSDYKEFLMTIIDAVNQATVTKGIKKPYLVIEPGRSIVGEAGITLYTVGAIKVIPDVKKYLAIDGGMFDNPRYALYQAIYTPILANRANEKAEETVSISGKCCESGDLICVNTKLPKANSGDIIAILSTGAYNYSMSSNYNRNKVPAAVLVKDGKAEYIIKPQTNEDLTRNDIIPNSLK